MTRVFGGDGSPEFSLVVPGKGVTAGTPLPYGMKASSDSNTTFLSFSHYSHPTTAIVHVVTNTLISVVVVMHPSLKILSNQ
jgi:hypothetical protein